jgi:hypothetical protein
MHQIGLIVYPGFQVLGLAMCAAFELANSAGDDSATPDEAGQQRIDAELAGT